MNRASRFYVVRLMNSALMNVKDLSLFPNSDQFGTCSYNAKSILLCETLVMEAQVHFSSSRFTGRNRNYSLFHGLRFVFYTLFTIRQRSFTLIYVSSTISISSFSKTSVFLKISDRVDFSQDLRKK